MSQLKLQYQHIYISDDFSQNLFFFYKYKHVVSIFTLLKVFKVKTEFSGI